MAGSRRAAANLLLATLAFALCFTAWSLIAPFAKTFKATTLGPWFRTLFYDPHPSLMSSAPIAYQVHAALPWLLYAVWPFSRLVHVWSYPLQYLGRPYILYRRRHPVPRRA